MTDEKKQEYARRISQANRTALVGIVYEIALDYMNEARLNLDVYDENAISSSLKSARSCMDNLISALDMQYDISKNLRGLYMFCKRELSFAQTRKNIEHINNAYSVIEKLKEAWTQIESTDASSKEFENAEQVYAGLTYGRGTLNVSVQDPTGNRGFKA